MSQGNSATGLSTPTTDGNCSERLEPGPEPSKASTEHDAAADQVLSSHSSTLDPPDASSTLSKPQPLPVADDGDATETGQGTAGTPYAVALPDWPTIPGYEIL